MGTKAVPHPPEGRSFLCANRLARVKRLVEPIGIQMAPHYFSVDADQPKNPAAALAGNARLFAGLA
jgi:hypothetical protein